MFKALILRIAKDLNRNSIAIDVNNDEEIQLLESQQVMQLNANTKLVRVKLDAKGLYILKAFSAGKEYSKKIMK